MPHPESVIPPGSFTLHLAHRTLGNGPRMVTKLAKGVDRYNVLAAPPPGGLFGDCVLVFNNPHQLGLCMEAQEATEEGLLVTIAVARAFPNIVAEPREVPFEGAVLEVYPHDVVPAAVGLPEGWYLADGVSGAQLVWWSHRFGWTTAPGPACGPLPFQPTCWAPIPKSLEG